jgi:hypothetical protein
MPKYDRKQISKELQATAQGAAYYGNAFYVALDIPELSKHDRVVLRRYLRGTETVSDRFELQNIANTLLEEPTP